MTCARGKNVASFLAWNFCYRDPLDKCRATCCLYKALVSGERQQGRLGTPAFICLLMRVHASAWERHQKSFIVGKEAAGEEQTGRKMTSLLPVPSEEPFLTEGMGGVQIILQLSGQVTSVTLSLRALDPALFHPNYGRIRNRSTEVGS